ncbi:molybdopterin molybdotransferase MoeA [Campylobacter sp. faydin G-105]|uniref:molybdopterin molybdotransferase MoeA n=1 Tax=Campylobacter anatolicus TaxID=2829105 RepID=UPI001B95A641|nr:molybdopterin molybdotransferase MoeA [Campylobacter anatolicus]MBR8462871.1 molybdopterin molybdotransferase MoeA [Campylobacter anatolicus]
MHVNEVIKTIRENFTIYNVSQNVPIGSAFDRVLSSDVIAVKNLPCFDNSALDGYAVKFDDKDKPYSIIGEAFAGDKAVLSIGKNECIKIMTGAKMPLGADTIVRFEDAVIEDDKLIAPTNLKRGNAHRFAGEEVKVGDTLLSRGIRLGAKEIMMLASQGISYVSVFATSRIGIYSSGNEIVEPWQWANEDQIYNANALGIASVIRSAGFDSEYLGIIKDDFEATKNAFKNAYNFDILICSGGASKGEADFMKMALNELGYRELFDKINMRPGGPCKAYVKDNMLIFILPGNPMAAYLCAILFVVPVLKNGSLMQEKVVLNESINIKSGRSNIVLGSIKDGKFYITDNNKFGSGMIKPLIKSNAIYVSNPDENELLVGSEIFVTRIS